MQTFSQIYSIMIIKSGNLLGFNKKLGQLNLISIEINYPKYITFI